MTQLSKRLSAARANIIRAQRAAVVARVKEIG
jgi:hypothetical protein